MMIHLNNAYFFHPYILGWIFLFGLALLLNLVNYLALGRFCFNEKDNGKYGDKVDSEKSKGPSNSANGEDDSWWKKFAKVFLVFLAGSLTTLIALWLIGFDFDLSSNADSKLLKESALQKNFIKHYMDFAQYHLNINHIEDNSQLYDALYANGVTSRGELAVLTHRAREWITLFDSMTYETFNSYADTLKIWSEDPNTIADLDLIDRLVLAIDMELGDEDSVESVYDEDE